MLVDWPAICNNPNNLTFFVNTFYGNLQTNQLLIPKYVCNFCSREVVSKEDIIQKINKSNSPYTDLDERFAYAIESFAHANIVVIEEVLYHDGEYFCSKDCYEEYNELCD